MKKALAFPFKSILFCFVSGLIITACNNGSEEKKGETTETRTAEALVTGTLADTTVNGTVKFTEEGDGKTKMDLELNIPALANHSVAVHIHEHGDCGDAGKAAGGHWNPTNKQHGKWGVGEFHSGDIGNVTLDSTGKGTYSLETDLWTIGGDVKTDILGKAIIVHAGEDDYTSQPAGNAGARVGCGVIQKQ
jgi:superoxide dismutase, Cu-Zn family